MQDIEAGKDREEFTYRGIPVPVINEETSCREDLLRYIRILEDRLDLNCVYVVRDEKSGSDIEDAGVPLRYDVPERTPAETAERTAAEDIVRSRFVRSSQTQEERVRTLCSGFDRISCMMIGEQLRRQMLESDI